MVVVLRLSTVLGTIVSSISHHSPSTTHTEAMVLMPTVYPQFRLENTINLAEIPRRALSGLDRLQRLSEELKSKLMKNSSCSNHVALMQNDRMLVWLQRKSRGPWSPSWSWTWGHGAVSSIMIRYHADFIQQYNNIVHIVKVL